MNTTTVLETMFSVHGKRPLEAQFNEYLKVFDQIGLNDSVKVFEHVRDKEDKFPTIRQMRGIIGNLGIWGKPKATIQYDDCYYCQGVGYIPYLLSPKTVKKISKYTTTVMACKCSAGQDLPESVQRYFDVHKSVQFEEEEEGELKDVAYPVLVTVKQTEFNDILRAKE
ncbi:MAG TPA: hypothetical protein EYF95_04715 [Flavobacteriales bacterium]|jgi:hypothetical protein|nr:hypothetical protein [Flavobacteriales bacterium]HIK67250.1 hypothetical protein [Flavobacteriales bacterium]